MIFCICLSVRLSQSHNLTCMFGGFNWATHVFFSYNCYFLSFCMLDFFLISSFNIWFVENWTSRFFQVYCFWSNNSGHGLDGLTRANIVFFSYFLYFFVFIIWFRTCLENMFVSTKYFFLKKILSYP